MKGCDKCGKYFMTKVQLRIHTNSVHKTKKEKNEYSKK